MDGVLPNSPFRRYALFFDSVAIPFCRDVYPVILTKRHSVAVKFQGIAMPSCVRLGFKGPHVSGSMCPCVHVSAEVREYLGVRQAKSPAMRRALFFCPPIVPIAARLRERSYPASNTASISRR